MTRKKRVLRTIRKESVDFTPFHLDFTSLLKKRSADFMKIPLEQFEQTIGNHLLQFDYKPLETFTPIRPTETQYSDEFGVIWDEKKKKQGDWSMVDHPLKEPDDSDYRWPKSIGPGRFTHVNELIEKNPGRANVMLTAGVFDTAWHITGFQNMLMYLGSEEAFVGRMLDKSLEFLVGVVNQLPEDVDGCRFTGDMGLQSGLMMRLEMWKKYLKPRVRILYEECHKRGLFVIKHSCGDNRDLISELIEIGVDVYDPLQPEVMDIKEIKQEFGKDIVFLGGLSCQQILPKGDPEDVKAHVFQTYEVMSKDGGYILAPAGSMPTDVPVENVQALVEACQEITPDY